MSYKKRHKPSPGAPYPLLTFKNVAGKRYNSDFERGYADGKDDARPARGWATSGYGRDILYSSTFNTHGKRMQLAKKTKKEPVRIFEFSDMRFEVYVNEGGELDLQHIKVIIPDNPSRNAEIIHQFSILNKLRRRQLGVSDFPAAYEREVVYRYTQLLPDEQDIVFNLLKAEYCAL